MLFRAIRSFSTMQTRNLASMTGNENFANNKMSDNVLGFLFHITINEGKEAEFREIVPQIAAKCSEEPGALDYTWCFNGRDVIVREAFVDAEAFKFHGQNTAEFSAMIGQVAKVTGVTATGPAEELDKLKERLDPLGAVYYTREAGFRKG